MTVNYKENKEIDRQKQPGTATRVFVSSSYSFLLSVLRIVRISSLIKMAVQNDYCSSHLCDYILFFLLPACSNSHWHVTEIQDADLNSSQHNMTSHYSQNILSEDLWTKIVLACVAGGIFGGQEVKVFGFIGGGAGGADKSEGQSGEK